MEAVQQAVEADPSLKLLSKTKLTAALRKRDSSIKAKDVVAYLAAHRDVVRERFAKPSNKHPKAKITAPPFSFQIDVVFISGYKAANKGVDCMLLVVDILSRKCFAYPLKSAKTKDVLVAYRKFLAAAGHTPDHVEGDNAFDASQFVDFNCKKSIPVTTGVAKDDHIASGDRLGIVDRMTRTLKALIARRIAADDDPKWTSWLQEVVDLYNRTPHDNLKADKQLEGDTPDEVYANEREAYFKWVRESDANAATAATVAQKFKVGDYVRRKLAKGAFDKESGGFTMSLEVYQVKSIRGTRLSVVDTATGQAYKRALKPNEVTKVDGPGPSDPNAIVKPGVQATAVAERAKVVKKIKSKAIGIEPATEAAAAQPLQTRKQREAAKVAAKAPAPEAVAPAGYDDHFEVERIVSDKVFKVNGRSVTKYEVEWKGYPDPDENTWEVATTLRYQPGTRQLLEDYLRAKQNRAAAGKRVETTRKKR